MSFDVESLRATEFPWTAGGDSIYLNSASTGPLPQRTRERMHEAIELRADPGRFPDALIFQTFARARELAARLVGGTPAEIALCTNTSYGLNLAAFALPLRAGDVVLAPANEFPANVYPWMAAAERRGFTYRQLAADCDGCTSQDALLQALQDGEVRALALSWVGFSSGYRYDLPALGRACREHGAFLVVDAIQGLGALALDVDACGIDILACGAQKWLLSPWGTGFTYVRRGLIDTLPPHVVGWTAERGGDDFSRLLEYDLTWREDARRFESLTLPTHDFIGMNESLELLLGVGLDAAHRHVEALVTTLVEWAVQHEGVELATPAEVHRRAGIVSLRFADPAAAHQRLRAAGVSHSMREGLVRLAPHVCNTHDEIRRTIAALEG